MVLRCFTSHGLLRALLHNPKDFSLVSFLIRTSPDRRLLGTSPKRIAATLRPSSPLLAKASTIRSWIPVRKSKNHNICLLNLEAAYNGPRVIFLEPWIVFNISAVRYLQCIFINRLWTDHVHKSTSDATLIFFYFTLRQTASSLSIGVFYCQRVSLSNIFWTKNRLTKRLYRAQQRVRYGRFKLRFFNISFRVE